MRPELARKGTKRAAVERGSAVELVARAASSMYGPPQGVDPADQLRHRLGARIRALRDARGLTQEVIADRIEVTPKFVSQLECGQRSPSWETLVAIAHHGFQIRLAALMFGIDEDIGAEIQDLNDMLAGRPTETRRDLLQAMELMLRAGAEPKL
ncbi:MAG TPA: helix-turn-helix transcriptional regulator [Kofleriaceae bacterium]